MSDRSEQQLIAFIAGAASTVSDASVDYASVDMVGNGVHHALTVVLATGAWTDGTHTFSLEDSPNDSDWTAVAAAYQIGADIVVDDATKDETVYLFGYTGGQRYVRLSVVVANVTTGLEVDAIAYVLDEPADAPV